MYKTAKLASFNRKVNLRKNFNGTFFSRLSSIELFCTYLKTFLSNDKFNIASHKLHDLQFSGNDFRINSSC